MKSKYYSFTNIEPLTQTEEIELVRAIARGNENALHKLVEANLGLVVSIARTHRGRGLSLDDLIGEGTLGLTRAARTFESNYETRFATYARFGIKQAIAQALLETTCVIQIPTHTRKLVRLWKLTRRSLTDSLGRTPTSAEIARSLGLSRTQLQNVEVALMAMTVKLESTIIGEDTGIAQIDVYQPEHDASETKRELLDLIRRRFRQLDGCERTVISLHYGFETGRSASVSKIAQRLRLSPHATRRILVHAVRKLRSPGSTAGD
jgi:RNA polymerase primary sigma factor